MNSDKQVSLPESEQLPTKEKILPKTKKKKKLLGFPGIIEKQLAPLNSNLYFKENYGGDSFDLLLIANDDRRAAILHVIKGQIIVEQVKNKPELLNPVKKQIKARITTDMETFLGVAMGKINPVKAVFSGKLKIRKLKTVLKFTKYFKVLAYIQKSEKST